MKTHLPFLLLIFFLTTSCIKKDSSTVQVLGTESVEGTYTGYRSQRIGQQAAVDSTKITLEVMRLPSGQVQILQVAPNAFKYLVNMQENRFTYNLGITEAACGAALLKGEGSFQGNKLYLLETLECTRNLSAAKTFVQLRATKQ